MDIVDRLLAHDTWTTRQLLLACQSLDDLAFDQTFDIDHASLRMTFEHIIGNMETWTDLLYERPVLKRPGNSIPALLDRLSNISRDFANITRNIVREQRYDDCFLDTLEDPPKKKTFGGTIGHIITHNMHHRAQIMYMMEKTGIKDHIEGDLLSWESTSFGWR
jgi:uncharacterized damage-inducible protein DinB